MWVLRLILVLVVTAYAGWLAWPLVSPFLEGAPPEAAGLRAVAVAQGSGLPQAGLWIGAILLYLVSAGLLAARNALAALAYLLGFLVEILLRLAIDQQGQGGAADVAARSTEVIAPIGIMVDANPVMLGVLAILGLLVLSVGPWGRRQRGSIRQVSAPPEQLPA